MYSIELYDRSGLRLAVFEETPLLEATRTGPDRADRILGLLPATVERVSHADRVRVVVDGVLFCEARVVAVRPQWSDSRKLILERYVNFHEVVEIEAEREAGWGDGAVSRAYVNKTPDAVVRDAINATLGAIHYRVDHGAYPEGAQREYQKFGARKLPSNELVAGAITSGDWVSAPRLDASGAYAKDGDTIAGLVVDGIAWPDVRLMMVDTEETSKNSHAVSRHPEIAAWTTAEYSASAYKVSADKSKAFLQSLIDTEGIDFVELNPHRDLTGAYDDRVDAYGRYIGLVYGGGMCFNAALVESGHSEVYLYEDGAYHVPEMALKEYFSYPGPSERSIDLSPTLISQLDFSGNLYELLTMAGYMAGGFAWHVDAQGVVHFRDAGQMDRVLFHDPVLRGVTLGSRSDEVVNVIYFGGNPIFSTLETTYARAPSVAVFDAQGHELRVFAIVQEADADLLVDGLLDDLAYPAPDWEIVFHHRDFGVRIGDIVEVRGAPFRQLDVSIGGMWGGLHEGKFVGRVRDVTHRFMGKRIETRVRLGSPLRSVPDPLNFITRSQPSEAALFQFRLDDDDVGVDLGYHLD